MWDEEDGLPSNYVNDIIQSEKGFLWLATENGMVRFDGVNFTTYNRTTNPGLLSNAGSVILEDRQGRIWFGTHGGGLYALKGDSLQPFTDQQGLPSNYVLSLAEDSSGTIWVGTDGEGLGKVMGDSVLKISDEEGINRHVHALEVDEHNRLWIGAHDGLYSHEEGSFKKHPYSNPLSSPTILALHASGGELFAGTPGGILKFRNGQVEAVDTGVEEPYVTDIIRDRKGNLWASSQVSGAFKITPDTVYHYLPGDSEEQAEISSVYSDREGNIWISNPYSGLYRLRDEVITSITQKDGLPNDLILSVTEGKEGEMWIATPSGITKYRLDSGKVLNVGGGGFDEFILSIQIGPDSILYAANRDGQLLKMSGNSMVRAGFPEIEGLGIWTLYQSRSTGALWAGTNRGVFRILGDEIKQYDSSGNKLSNNDVRAITEDRDGRLWVGTSYGLNRLEGDTFVSFTENDAFLNQQVVSLHADDHGDVWAGTYGGLYRIRNREVKPLTQAEGLPEERIAAILEDDQGSLWLGTPEGLYRIDKDQLNGYIDHSLQGFDVEHYGRTEGMKNSFVTMSVQPVGWKALSGDLWFATGGGVSVVDPSDVSTNPVPLKVFITSAKVDQREPRNIQAGGIFELPRNNNELEINFSAPSFIEPSQIQFRYKLEGLHTDWVEAGNRRTAYFSRIPPGEYTFQVIAANEDGIWSHMPATLPLVISPPFWMSWWFILLSMTLFLSCGPALYFRKVAKLNRKQEQQKEFTRKLIESQEAERNRIASELHDSLGQNLIIIKNRALMGRKDQQDPDKAAEQLEEISRTASLAIEEMRKISHNLRPFNLERFGLSRTVSSLVTNADESSEIRFKQDIGEVDKVLSPEQEIQLFRIIQESISNILKHSGAYNATVVLTKNAAGLTLRIEDDGKGFIRKQVPASNGIGLEDMEQRADLLNGRLQLFSAPGEGTTIHLSIPLNEEDV